MTLFERFNKFDGPELPAQNVPYIGGHAAVLRGNVMMVEHDNEQVAIEISDEDAARFARSVAGHDPYSDAGTARAALEAAADIQWRGLRWQQNGHKKVHEGAPIKLNGFGEPVWLPKI